MIYERVEDLIEKGGIAPIDAGQPDDVYLVAASYEPRSIALTGALAPHFRAVTSFVYFNKEFLSSPAAGAIKTAIDHLQQDLGEKSEKVHVVKGSWENAFAQVEAMRDAFGYISAGQTPLRITIDTTTFNREALIVSLALLTSRFPSARIRALYVSPEHHGDWLSRGYRNVRSIVGFAGIQQASRRNVLIVLTGFEGDRTFKIIEEYEPSQVLLGIGDPPTVSSFLDRNISEHKLLLGRTDVETFNFPANNVAGCVTVLETCLSPLIDSRNLVVAPMSTKLSTLAAFKLAERYSEIQLAYCLPGEYNYSEYSTGTSRVFIEDLK